MSKSPISELTEEVNTTNERLKTIIKTLHKQNEIIKSAIAFFGGAPQTDQKESR